MKNILKSLVIGSLFFGAISCEDEQDLKFLTPEASFEILSPTSGDAIVLSPDTPTNPGLSISWTSADFGTPTQVNYEIQIDKSGDEFDTPVILNTTNNTFAVINSQDLNGAVVSAGLTPFSEGAIEIRIRATVGTGSSESFSNVITYLVTPYSTDLPKLAVPGNHQGWDPPTAPRIAASAFGEVDYEGYAWLDGEFKFVAPDNAGNFNWGNIDWGDDGSFSGVLAQGSPTNCGPNAAGYYFITANTDNLTYSTTAVNWGIIGAATPTGWTSDTDFTYNPTTKQLEIASIALTPGNFKFRGNNTWGQFDLGQLDEDGYLQFGGDLTFDGPAGNYKVILDLSNPRMYTYELIAL